MKEQRTLEEIRHAGYSRGRNIASHTDVPEIGDTVQFNECGIKAGSVVDTEDEAWELASSYAFNCESESRSFSPFEFTAYEFNNRDDAEECWEAFNGGIADGIAEELAARRAKREARDKVA